MIIKVVSVEIVVVCVVVVDVVHVDKAVDIILVLLVNRAVIAMVVTLIILF